MYNILTGSVKMNSIYGALLISVSPEMMPSWQKIVKRIMDLFFSTIAIIILSPIFIILSVLIKSGSKGKIIFKQERIGLKINHFRFISSDLCILILKKMAPNFQAKTIIELLLLEGLCAKLGLMKLLNF